MVHSSETLENKTRALQYMIAVRNRLRNSWTQAPQARDAYGTYCNAYDADARKWSLNGAIIRECREDWLMTIMVRSYIRNELRNQHHDYTAISEWSVESPDWGPSVNIVGWAIERLKQELAYDSLCKVRELIIQGWTQLGYARDGHGRFCDIHDKNAVRWSLMGAIEKVCHKSPTILASTVIRELHVQLDTDTDFLSLKALNMYPGTTREDIFELIGNATARLRTSIWGRT